MDLIKAKFKEVALDFITIYEYENLVKKKPELYNAIISMLVIVNNKHINNDILTLFKSKISTLKLKEGVHRNFIFCGCYMFQGKKTVLLENIETIGTYYIKNTVLFNRLKDYKIGMKIGLEKDDENNYKLLTPYENINIGLFDEL